MLNGRGVVENGIELARRRGIVADDKVWFGTPLFYGLGATNALPATLTLGATIVLQDYFEAGRAIDVIHRSGATVYYGRSEERSVGKECVSTCRSMCSPYPEKTKEPRQHEDHKHDNQHKIK